MSRPAGRCRGARRRGDGVGRRGFEFVPAILAEPALDGTRPDSRFTAAR
ncbi:hypothetical protein [Parafrankia sp. EUN1f]|nr:hypothetical protein [Parafrankia sp. EUN1f]